MIDVPQDVRDSMVLEAWKLIAERGLEGMSTREVLARTGAPRGSVYHYFPRGRIELVEEALGLCQRWTRQRIEAIEGETETEVVSGYVDIWRWVLESSGFQAGCAVAGLVTGAHDPDLLDRSAAAFISASDALAARLRKIGTSTSNADRLATLVLCAVEGAVLICRAQREIEPLNQIRDMLLARTRRMT